MLDNGGFFDIETIVAQVLVILPSEMGKIGQNKGIFGKYPKCRFFNTRYFHDFFMVVKATPQCFKSRFGSLKICNTGVKNDAFFNICEKKHFFVRSICAQKVPYGKF